MGSLTREKGASSSGGMNRPSDEELKSWEHAFGESMAPKLVADSGASLEGARVTDPFGDLLIPGREADKQLGQVQGGGARRNRTTRHRRRKAHRMRKARFTMKRRSRRRDHIMMNMRLRIRSRSHHN